MARTFLCFSGSEDLAMTQNGVALFIALGKIASSSRFDASFQPGDDGK